MKRFGFLLLTLCMLLSVLPFSAVSADGADITDWRLNGINTACQAGQVVVYTVSGSATGTDDGCTEVQVGADGRITAVGGCNNTVPDGGFIVAGGGSGGRKLQKLSVGDGMYYDETAMTVTAVASSYTPFYGHTVHIDAVNGTRKQDTVVLYTESFGAATGTNAWGYEVTVNADGFITAVGGNDSEIPDGGYVLSGHGAGKTVLEEAASLGMRVTLADDKKTATLSFDSASAAEACRVRIGNFYSAWEQAKEDCLLVNDTALQAAYDTLSSHAAALQDACDCEDYLLYVKYSRAFDTAYKNANLLLAEEQPVEARAVWLRPALNADRNYIFATVKSIWEAGFNQVCLELLFDNTTIMPMPEDSYFVQNPAFSGSDPLALYIEACHSYGIEIHAWMSVFRVGYKGSSNTQYSVGTQKPGWLNLSKNGLNYVANAYGDAFFLNPALPEVQDFLLNSYTYILQTYDLDGLQLDYVRYPNKEDGEEFGYDDYTCSLFASAYGIDPRTLNESAEEYGTFCQFRADFVTDFVRKVKALLNEYRPDMYLSAAVAPGYSSSLYNMNQDTLTWLSEGLLDIVYPMAYGTTDAVVRYTDETLSAAGENAFAFIGVSDQGAEIFSEQILAVRENGADGVAFFSWSVYDSRYDTVQETLFASSALSPTYNGKAAMLAELDLMRRRIAQNLPSLSSLVPKIDTVYEKLEPATLTDCGSDLQTLLTEIADAADGVCGKLAEDCAAAQRILHLNRDDAKAAYIAEHPLPESLLPTGTGEPEESADTSASDETAKESETELTPVEKVFQVISMIILFGGLALIPVYFVLNARRKRIVKSFDGQKGDEDERDT